MLKKCEVFVKNGGKMPEDEEDRVSTRQRAKVMHWKILVYIKNLLVNMKILHKLY